MKACLVAIALLAALPLSAAPTIDRAAMAAKVRAEFLHSWKAYERYAWGHVYRKHGDEVALPQLS